MSELYTERELALAIHRTCNDPAFAKLIDEFQAPSAPVHARSFLFAQALVKAFGDVAGGADIVSITSPQQGGQVEHCGVRIGRFIWDSNGMFASEGHWIDGFMKKAHVLDRPLSFDPTEPPKPSGMDESKALDGIAAMLRAHIPDAPEVVKRQVSAFRVTVLQDPEIIAVRAQGLQFNLHITGQGLEIYSIGLPDRSDAKQLAFNFLNRLCQLADAHSTPLLLDPESKNEHGLSDWYRLNAFLPTDNLMERMPGPVQPDENKKKKRAPRA